MPPDPRTLAHRPPAEMSGGFPKADAYVGTVIDSRYVLERPLGEGGMGIVYVGRHVSLDKRVAVKVLKRELAEEREMVDRFFNEARAASSIGSPHIVDVADFGMLADGAAYFVMELLDGRSLGELLDAEKVLPEAKAIDVARQIANGLGAAHAAGIVHRDLKPDNVMLVSRGAQRDFVKILDFGIAKVSTAATRLTRTGSVFGTPHYMSPEQAAGLSVDNRCDIYALGVILYEMTCGKVPFDADTYMGILTQHMYKAPAPPRTLPLPRPVSPGLEAIIMKSLSKRPAERYASMEALVADLDVLSSGATPAAVGELLARSGSHSVPGDYFHDRGGGAVSASTQMSLAGVSRPGSSRVGLAVGAVVGLVAAVALLGFAMRTSAPAPTAAGPSPSVVQLKVEPVASVVPPAVAATKTVAVVVTPQNATVTVGGVDVPVEKGGIAKVEVGREPIAVVVSKPGYTSVSFQVGPTSAPFERVDLSPVAKSAVGPVPVKPGPAVTVVPPPSRPAHCSKVGSTADDRVAYPECFR
ncbi:MAG: serine/threonine protein kinase [Myxococcales bacterium]|nr:serine/threonine protein kinase [Myxococcales bacterium]